MMTVFFNAERFKVLRREKGLSQEQLAVAAGVSCSTVTAIETGRNINPSVSTLLKLATCLDVALADFFYSKALEVLVEAGAGKEVKKIKRKGRK